MYCHSSKTVQGGIRQNNVQRWSIFHIGLIAHCPDPPRWALHFYYIEQYWVRTYYDTRHQPNVHWCEENKMVFVPHKVPFPAKSDWRSRVAGNSTEWEVKIILKVHFFAWAVYWWYVTFFSGCNGHPECWQVVDDKFGRWWNRPINGKGFQTGLSVVSPKGTGKEYNKTEKDFLAHIAPPLPITRAISIRAPFIYLLDVGSMTLKGWHYN